VTRRAKRRGYWGWQSNQRGVGRAMHRALRKAGRPTRIGRFWRTNRRRRGRPDAYTFTIEHSFAFGIWRPDA
jgi:hypothetical protein